MHNFKELKVWQKSRQLAMEIYEESQQFPHSEVFGLQNQIRRSAISITSNIAEACGRRSDRQLLHFPDIDSGSASQQESQVLVAGDLKFRDCTTSEAICEHISEI